MQDNYHRATFNAEVATNAIELRTLEGRDHLVAPVVAVREMVLKGEFLPAEEIEASVPAWNGRVLPIGHPTDGDGNFMSANQPGVHDEQTVGRFFEAESSESALQGNIWLDVERSQSLASETGDERYAKPLAILSSHAEDGTEAANVADDVDVQLNEGDILEVSTAYFYQREDAMGNHEGESYEATQHNVRPDHLALLPNSKGECSAEDGCGAPRVHVHANVESQESSDGQDTPGHSFGVTDGEQATISNYSEHMTKTIEWLASHTEFDRETLEGFEESHLETLRESVDHDDCGCGGAGTGNEGQDGQTNSGDGDGDSGGVPEEFTEELSALREEVQTLREERQTDKARDHAERIVAHAEQFEGVEDVFETLGKDEDTLATMADEFERQAAAAQQADMGGRVGANSSPGGGRDEDAEDYANLAREANAARFGDPEESD